jgi:DNA-binding PadR family transcriptional regulator
MKRPDTKRHIPGREMLSPWANLPDTRWSKKPPRIDIKFPILGFLMESEMTGYDLKRRFQDPIGFFYRASDGSLYPALKKLAQDGLVTMRSERHGRRARKVYAITAKGRERFLHALREPAAPIFVYDEAQVKIYFAHHDPQAALQHIERERQFAEAWSAWLEQLLEDMRARNESPFRMSVVEIGRGITSLKAELFERLRNRLARGIEISTGTQSAETLLRSTGRKAGDSRTPARGDAGATHGRRHKPAQGRRPLDASIR